MTLEATKEFMKTFGLEFLSEVHPRDLITIDEQSRSVPAGRLPENESVLPAGTELIRRPHSKLWAKDSEGRTVLVCFA